MILLEPTKYLQIYEMYLKNRFFYPLIASVLLNEQNGKVYVDHSEKPSQIYVEHAFGFAQVFGDPNALFEQQLEHYLLREKRFRPDKIRLYTPYLPPFITSPHYESLRSYRQRFILNEELFHAQCLTPNKVDPNLRYYEVTPMNAPKICEIFGITSRFWRNTKDFALKSYAVVAFHKEKPASICYAAAVANKHLEIDVLTLPEYRKQGLAKSAAIHFIQRCFASSLSPLWDCFTNNQGSMNLCQSLGFTALHAPYPFFTINKGASV
ncbi:GNAT family N-acetyltransferase [Legionella feeleii]|uniref:GNAT acetyltransferase n=1 Tax=Legionella feeleii TaxID=453 RepID=A0A378IXH7_9GAMM|nr:GNAT family N-acetyltransferase [Legionella feeleii]STX39946.1 GNAT acetyltransferase [Legionella feeleii]